VFGFYKNALGDKLDREELLMITNNDVTYKGDSLKVSGTNDGTNWTSLTVNGTTKNIPSGGSSISGITNGTGTNSLIFGTATNKTCAGANSIVAGDATYNPIRSNGKGNLVGGDSVDGPQGIRAEGTASLIWGRGSMTSGQFSSSCGNIVLGYHPSTTVDDFGAGIYDGNGNFVAGYSNRANAMSARGVGCSVIGYSDKPGNSLYDAPMQAGILETTVGAFAEGYCTKALSNY